MADPTLNLCDPVIKLLVGNNCDAVQVHQGILCKTSDFFKNAMKPEWAALKPEPHTIALPDHALDDVGHYARWLYAKEVGAISDELRGCTNGREALGVFCKLVDAYIYSEMILDTAYNKAMFKVLIETLVESDWVPGPKLVNMLYEKSFPGSLARSFLMASIAHEIHFHGSEKIDWHGVIKKYPQDALIDLVRAMSEYGAGSPHARSHHEIGQKFLGRL